MLQKRDHVRVRDPNIPRLECANGFLDSKKDLYFEGFCFANGPETIVVGLTSQREKL